MKASNARGLSFANFGGDCCFFLVYAIFTALTAISTPSTRFANPVEIGGGIVMSDGGDVYSGQVSYLGVPLRFLTWRDEAVEPRHDARKHTVAVHFGFLPAAFDTAFVVSILMFTTATAYRW